MATYPFCGGPERPNQRAQAQPPSPQGQRKPPRPTGRRKKTNPKIFGTLGPSWDPFSINFFDKFWSAPKLQIFYPPKDPKRHAAGAKQAVRPPTHTQQPESRRHSGPVRCTDPRETYAAEPFPLGKGSFFGKGCVAPSGAQKTKINNDNPNTNKAAEKGAGKRAGNAPGK